jgi:hypothetical protein
MKSRITAVLAAVLLSTSSAFAWDGDGHMQVAEIAWTHLTTASRARASALLKHNPNYHTWIAKVPTAKRKQVAFVMAATWPAGGRAPCQPHQCQFEIKHSERSLGR